MVPNIENYEHSLHFIEMLRFILSFSRFFDIKINYLVDSNNPNEMVKL